MKSASGTDMLGIAGGVVEGEFGSAYDCSTLFTCMKLLKINKNIQFLIRFLW